MNKLSKEEDYEIGLENLFRKIREEKLVPLAIIGYQEREDHRHPGIIIQGKRLFYKEIREIIEKGIIQLEEKLSEDPEPLKLNNPD